MKPEYLTRQYDLIPSRSLTKPIHIIGAGAIGSWVALALAKMGCTDLTVYDFDMIDEENMNCQFYPPSMIGMQKTQAIKRLVKSFTGTTIATASRYEGAPLKGIVISAVDNMEVRKLIFESQKKSILCEWIVDPRMSAEQGAMYVMNPMSPKDIETYSKTLYTDSEAVFERCTAKATIYTANLLSGLVAKATKDLLLGGVYPRVTLWDIAANQMHSYPGGDHGASNAERQTVAV